MFGFSSTTLRIKRAAIHIGITDTKGSTESLILFLIQFCQLVSLSYRWPLPWGLLLAPRVHILLQQHESKGRHFFLNLLFLVPLLFHHLLQLEASQLHAPLALVVQDVRIRPLHQGSLQAPQFLLSLVVRPLTPAAPHQGQVALDVAVGAAAPGRRQPDPVVHGPVPGGAPPLPPPPPPPPAAAAAASERKRCCRCRYSSSRVSRGLEPPPQPTLTPPRFLKGRSGHRLRHSHLAWAALHVSTTN